MFEKSLADLVRGIRRYSNKKNEAQYISQCIQEIKEEIVSNDPQKKMVAVQKLTYLQMLGYDMSWAAFRVIEVMSQHKFSAKRVGYLAACQSFNENTDVITLATHLLRKDMTSPSMYESGLAINCLSNICTPDLARELAADVVAMLTSSRPYIKKKACLVLYKIFLKFPDALRPAFPKLKEKLEDPDPSVQSAAVNVICELARKNPKNYLSLAPTLFKILTSSTNNWMLIKIIKLFGALLPIEPRLAKKLEQPLVNLINTTPAMSLLYECIQTCTVGLGESTSTIRLCISKLRNFVEDQDQNLKYLGLIALNNIMKINPKAVAEHRDLVLNCLDDDDVSIRLRALDLLEGMTTKRNIVDIVKKLLDHIEKAESGIYKDALVEKIIGICSKNSYQHITDFEWYTSVLAELAHTQGTKHGDLLASQFMDVIIRVKVVRPQGVRQMAALLRDMSLVSDLPAAGGNCEVLYAAGWLVGEFACYIEDPKSVIECLMHSRAVTLPSHIQAVYMQAVLKIFSQILSPRIPDGEEGPEPATPEQADDLVNFIKERLGLFTQSQHLEVQERACFISELVNLYTELKVAGEDISPELSSVFTEALNPVAAKAQKKVPIPEGLDLDAWINEPPEDTYDEVDRNFDFLEKPEDIEPEPREEETEETRQQRKDAARQRLGVWYIKSDDSATPKREEELPPMVRVTKKDLGLDTDSKRRGSRARTATRQKRMQKVEILQNEEMPEGAKDDDSSEENEDKEGLGMDIDWSSPLKPEEQLKRGTHRVVTAAPAKPADTKEKKKSREGRRKKEEGKTAVKGGKKKKTKKSEAAAPAAESSLIDISDQPVAAAPAATESYLDIGSPSVPVKEETAVKKTKKTKTKGADGKPLKTKKTKKGTEPVKKKKAAASSAAAKSKAEPVADAPSVAAVSNVAPLRPVPSNRQLFKDENLSVMYELRVNPQQPKKVMVVFELMNLSQEAVSGLEFNVKGTLNTKIAADAQPKPDITIQPGESAKHNILFDCISIQQPQKLGGNLTYQVGENNVIRDFQLVFPCSAFILPIALSQNDFIEVLKAGQFSLGNIDIRPEGEWNSFIFTLRLLLHVELVKPSDGKGVALYGRSVQNHHVAVYIRQPPANTPIHIDIKCTDSLLATSLVNEVGAFFQRA